MKVGFIGFGNMAQAITKGLVNAKVLQPEDIYACAAHYDKLENNARIFKIHPCKNVKEVIEQSDIIIIAVKPYQITKVMQPAAELIGNKMVISIAAGFYYDKLIQVLPEAHFISAIPNTPISVGQGILMCEEKNTLSEDQKAQLVRLFEPVAMIEAVDSKLINIAGTISGCSPAFAAMFIEALADAGVKHGLSRNLAYALSGKVLEGTGALFLDQGVHPGVLKDAVCSPGGTTIKGVSSLEKDGFRGDIINAIDAIIK